MTAEELFRNKREDASNIDAEILRLKQVSNNLRSTGIDNSLTENRLRYLENIRLTLPDNKGANYVVTHGGTIIANQAIIRGAVYANEGVFSGAVYANEGFFNGDIHSDNAYIRGEVHATSGSFTGTISSNANDNRIVIDPNERSLKMLNAKDQVLSLQDFFINGNFSGGRLRINLINQETNTIHCYAEVDGGKIAIYRDGVVFTRFDAYQQKIWIDADLLPQSRDAAFSKEMYMDGEAVKVKRGE